MGAWYVECNLIKLLPLIHVHAITSGKRLSYLLDTEYVPQPLMELVYSRFHIALLAGDRSLVDVVG
jgi:hypothetical protein